MAGTTQVNIGILSRVTLSAGSYLDNAASGVITDATSGGAAVLGTGGPSTVTNAGGIFATATGDVGVLLQVGGTVDNTGTISSTGAYGSGIKLRQGGSVTNGASGVTNALIQGGISAIYSGFTLTNYGTISAYRTAISSSSGGTITNGASGTPGALILGAVALQNAPGTITNNGTIQATRPINDYGVQLGSGGSLSNAAGALIEGYRNGVVVIYGDNTLTNHGTIKGDQNFGIFVSNHTGTVTNDGTISGAAAGIYLNSGGSVTNAAGGLIQGPLGIYTNGGGTVTNSGSITGVTAVFLWRGGTVTNTSGGVLSGSAAGISIGYGSGTVTNLGTIKTTGDFSRAISLFENAVVTNGAIGTTTAVIQASGTFAVGIYNQSSGATITNYGTVAADQDAIQLISGGTVVNGANGNTSALISGGSIGVGVAITGGGGTVVNAGTIGGGGGTAVSLDSKYGGRVVIDPGAVFAGTVSGGNAALATLELASAASTGIFAGLGTQFINFGSVAVDAGAVWSVTDNFTVAGGTTLINAGSLSFSGTLDDAGTLISTNGAAISFAGGGLLIVEQGAVIQGAIGGFLPGTTIDLAGISATSAHLGANNALNVQLSGGGTLTLNLAQNQNYGSYSFTVDSDGHSGSDISVLAGHPGPIAGSGTTTVGHGQQVDLTSAIGGLVTPGVPGDTETVTAISAQQGTVTLNNGHVTYMAPSSGSGTLSYTVTDENGNTAAGSLTVATDPGPTAGTGTLTIGHNKSLDLTSQINKLIGQGLPGDIETVIGVTGGATLGAGGIITYTAPSSGPDSFTYTVKDQYGDTATGSVNVTVDPGPTAGTGTLTIGHNKSLDLTSQINKLIGQGLPGDIETVIGVTGGATLAAGGIITYTAPSSGPDSFTYTVKDQYGDTATGSVNMTVDPGPTAGTGTLTIGHNKSLDLTSQINKLIGQGLPGDIETVIGVTGGATLAAGGIITYTAPSSGPDSFTYTVKDQYGDTATGSVNVTVDPGPTAGTGTLTIGHNQSLDLTSLINGLVKAPSGDTETVTSVSSAVLGPLIPKNGAFTYTAPSIGPDTITYTVGDKYSDTATGSISVTVDRGPGAGNGAVTLGHNQTIDLNTLILKTLSLVSPGLTGNIETVTAASSAVGTVGLGSGGNVTLTTPSSGSGTLSYTVTDNYGDIAIGSVAITVTPGPTAGSGSKTIGHDKTVDLTSLINGLVTDPSGAKDTVTGISTTFGTVGLTNGDVTFSASGGSGTLTYTVTDPYGDTATGNVNMTVDPGPTAGTGTLIIGHNQSLDLTSQINKLIGQGLPGDIETVIGVSGGATLGAGGTITYTAPSSGPASFTYTVKDQYGDTATGTVNVIVDTGPVAGTGATKLSPNKTADLTSLIKGLITPGLAGDTETVTAVKAAHGSASLAGGIITYTAPASGPDTLSYTVTDQYGDTANGTVNVSTAPADPGPTAKAAAITVVGWKSTDLTSYLLSLATPGIAGDTLTLTGDNTAGARGTVTLANGDLSYTAPLLGTDSFGYTVSDQFGNTASATVTLTMAPLGIVGGANPIVVLGDNSGPIIFGNTNVTVIGGSGSVQVIGGTGTNTITLGDGSDTLVLGDGANTITLGNGSDTLVGGDGANKTKFGNGNDTLVLGDGANQITLGNGNDSVVAGDGANMIALGNGNDSIVLGNGANKITLGTGSNTLTAGNQSNTVGVTGSATSTNTITVGNGNNTLTLGAGTYKVTEGNGADTILLGNGKYNVTAGTGTDLFVYSTPSALLTMSFGSTDKLVFRDSGFNLGANDGQGTASLQAIATSLLSSHTDGTFATTTNRFAYDKSSGNLYYDADGSAAGSSRVLIADLTNKPHLTAANLFFTS